jgi:hypothetical protein
VLYSGKQIVGRIKTHVTRRGGPYPTWFVGISKKPSVHLFQKHRVRKVGDAWILMHAESHAVARKAALFLVKKLRMAEAMRSEDPQADFVYAYKKSRHTRP